MPRVKLHNYGVCWCTHTDVQMVQNSLGLDSTWLQLYIDYLFNVATCFNTNAAHLVEYVENVFMNCQFLWSAREECIVETVEMRDLTLLKWWTIHYDLVFRWLQLFIGQIVRLPLTTCGSEILIETLSLLSTHYQPQATGPTQTFMKEDQKKFHAEKLKTSHERAACKHGPSSS